ncbi:MAG: aldo/keto reductase, partial [Bdellovibrionales bacterium]|nr:aldo/keto reductase [Bdellovibrionales bacterium]
IQVDETLEAMQGVVEAGAVKSIGVSNFPITAMREVQAVEAKQGIVVSVNQVEFHPLLFQQELLEFCRAQETVVTAYSPLARGRALRHETVQEIATQRSVAPAQVVLAWLLHHRLVAVPKAASRKHLEENIAACRLALTPGELLQLDNIREEERLIAPSWARFDEAVRAPVHNEPSQ